MENNIKKLEEIHKILGELIKDVKESTEKEKERKRAVKIIKSIFRKHFPNLSEVFDGEEVIVKGKNHYEFKNCGITIRTRGKSGIRLGKHDILMHTYVERNGRVIMNEKRFIISNITYTSTDEYNELSFGNHQELLEG